MMHDDIRPFVCEFEGGGKKFRSKNKLTMYEERNFC